MRLYIAMRTCEVCGAERRVEGSRGSLSSTDQNPDPLLVRVSRVKCGCERAQPNDADMDALEEAAGIKRLTSPVRVLTIGGKLDFEGAEAARILDAMRFKGIPLREVDSQDGRITLAP